MLEIVPDIAQSTHGIRNISADIRNVPTSVPCDSDDGYDIFDVQLRMSGLSLSRFLCVILL